MTKDTRVICGFPGVGKTYCVNNNDSDLVIIDSDSSLFSWEYDENGNKTNVRNKDFPNNYIGYIKENIGKVDIIFVSTHNEVIKALNEHKIKHAIIYPNLLTTCKYTWINRYVERGSEKEFVDLMIENFYTYIMDIENDVGEYSILHPIEDDEWISDIIFN